MIDFIDIGRSFALESPSCTAEPRAFPPSGNRMNAVRINSSLFKEEVGRGGCLVAISSIKPPLAPHPHPSPPLEGEGVTIHAIALVFPPSGLR